MKQSIHLYRSLMLLLFALLWQVIALAKHNGENVNRLVEEPKTKQLLKEIPETVIVRSTFTVQHLLISGMTLDSLKQKVLAPVKLVHYADSIQKTFFQDQRIISKLKSVGFKLPEQLDASTVVSKDTLMPVAITKDFGALQQIGNLQFQDELSSLQSLSNPSIIPDLRLPTIKINTTIPNVNKLKNPVTVGAIDHFAAFPTELNQARRELSKYNGRLEKINNLQELKGKYLFLNPLKGKPWKERVILGTLWQFSQQKEFLIDLGPSLAWRLTDLFAVGTGFQYRLSVTTKNKPWVSSTDKVFGYRLFSDVQIMKSYFGRLDYEILSASVPRPNSVMPLDATEQQWIKSLSIGLGKSYTFYKIINGYALMQYNIMHRSSQTPYLRPLQAKIGFYIYANQLRKPNQ